ncbi:MAG: YqaA family protein [Alphaproteobacteria bacterium]
MKFGEFMLKKSESTLFSWIVFFMTVCESIFLFVPPEVFMTPPIIANKSRAVPTVAAAAVGSVVGGIIAYLIGAMLFDSVGVWIIEHFASVEQFHVAQQLFVKHGLLIILITAVTPVPYKLMSICAGFMGFPAVMYICVSAIFRTGRFAIVGFLLWKFQEKANSIVKKYFWQITIAAIVAAGAGIFLFMI